MRQLGPMMVTARSKEHAEYLIRSRAEQRGVLIESLEVTGGSSDMWAVTVEVGDDVDATVAGRLVDDTQVMHFDTHRSRH